MHIEEALFPWPLAVGWVVVTAPLLDESPRLLVCRQTLVKDSGIWTHCACPDRDHLHSFKCAGPLAPLLRYTAATVGSGFYGPGTSSPWRK